MSKPKRRTMRRLKRTLGVTAIILAMLIAMIPDIGHAEPSVTASMEIVWGSGVSKQTNTAVTDLAIAVANSVVVNASGQGRANDHYRLIVYNSADKTSTTGYQSGYETEIFEYSYKIERVTHDAYTAAETVYNEGVSGGTIIESPGDYDIFAHATKDPIQSAELFSFGLNYTYSLDTYYDYYSSVYFNNSLISSVQTSSYRSNNVYMTTGMSNITGAQANEGFSVLVYLNRNPVNKISAVNDMRGYKTATTYQVSDPVAGSAAPTAATELTFDNVDYDNGIKSMSIPSQNYTLRVSANSLSKSDFVGYASAATQASTSISKLDNYSEDRIDVIDAISLRVVFPDGSDVGYTDFYSNFNDFAVSFSFPTTNTGSPYSYRAASTDNGDSYRVAYCLNGTWYDGVPFSGTRGSYDNRQQTITMTLNGLVSDVVIYIARGDANLYPVDRRSDIAGADSVLYAELNGTTTGGVAVTEDDLLSDVYLIVDNATPSAGIQSVIDGYYASEPLRSHPTYNKDDKLITVNYKSNSAGTVSAANIFEDGDSWSSTRDYEATICAALPAEWNPVDTNYAAVYVYGYNTTTDSWEALWDTATRTSAYCYTETVTGLQMVQFTHTSKHSENVILIYEAPPEAGSGSFTGYDARVDRGTWVDGSTSNSVVPTASTIPTGTYYLVLSDEGTPGNTTIYRSLDSYPDITDNYKRNSKYYRMKITRNNYTTQISSSTYSDFGTVNVQFALPTALVGGNANSIKLLTYNPLRGDALLDEYGSSEYTVQNGYIQFRPKHFTGELECALFYNSNSGSGSSSTASTASSGSTSRNLLGLDDRDCALITAVGAASTPTELEGQQWDLVIRDSDRSGALRTYLSSKGGVYADPTMEIYPYDMKLYYKGQRINEVSEDDYANTEITVVIPFPEDMQSRYQNGDSVEFYEMIRSNNNWRLVSTGSSSAVNKPVYSIDASAKTITLKTRDLIYNTPYAIVHFPKEEPYENEFEAIAWPTAVEMPDSNLTSSVDFMQLEVGLPDAYTNIPGYDDWKLMISQYAPDSVAETTLIASKLKDPQAESTTGYRPTSTSTTAVSSTATSTTTTTTTTTTSQGKSIIKVYNLQVWEYDSTQRQYVQQVSNDVFDKSNGKGIEITLPLNGALIGNKGTAQIWTINSELNDALEPLTGKIPISSAIQETTFRTYHFSQYAILYTPAEVVTTTTESSNNNNSSKSGTSGSTANASNTSTNNNTGSANSATSGSTNNSGTGSNSTGGGGNRAGGDNSVDMPRTADATTYKAIFILILLAFGAFELISSMPAKKKATVRAEK
ncbi:MAG: hypothetical protein K6G16_06255 [Lachnospiraceae bacterium]|nr:hypothetical protein [Lachnospiraceae bacterium]